MDNKINNDFLKEFNFWVSTLPGNKMKNITASYVVDRLDHLKISYEQAKNILSYSEGQGILEKNFLIKCPECDRFIKKLNRVQLANFLLDEKGTIFCEDCEENFKVPFDSIFVTYDVIKKPMTSVELGNELNKRLNIELSKEDKELINLLNKELNLNIESIEDWRSLIE